MNIMTILNKLKENNMIASNEEGLNLFSDCFNKFGISLLLLKSVDEFNKIIDLLSTNKIPLQKANGIYTLRVFAVDYYTLVETIDKFEEVKEIEFLRNYPEVLSEPKTIKVVLSNIKNYQSKQESYKNGNTYDYEKLTKEVVNNENSEPVNNDDSDINEVNSFLKTLLDDVSIIDKLNRNEENPENFAVTMEIQKIENQICEDYLFPIENGWGIIINNINVNNFQEVKENLNKLTKLSIPMSTQDIMKVALIYNSKLSSEEIREVVAALGGN